MSKYKVIQDLHAVIKHSITQATYAIDQITFMTVVF